MRTITTLVLIAFIATTSFAQNTLDGKTFEIKIVEKKRMGDPKKMKGVILFEKGKVGGSISDDNGYSPAKYSTDSKDGLVSTFVNFTAEAKGKKDILSWEGIINGDEIEGTAIRKRKGEIRTIFEFKGTLKEK
ncbi:MAG: hypothetical protein COB15_03240 [Flavobacteriales bacterium]|nr:MAG: hypothetical protein COB15_03240 [Flavobacteriales bacterium]